MEIPFTKYHGLGNDYIVIEPLPSGLSLTERQIRTICRPHYGVGSDGILYGPEVCAAGELSLRIFNPDGSIAEKSGNGLRIFARHLWETGRVGADSFTVYTAGGPVTARVSPGGRDVVVEMGRITFDSENIPVTGPPREVINEVLDFGDVRLSFCAAEIGNPHCVVIAETVSEEIARLYGPKIETDPRFPKKTNVQFMKVIDERTISIEIWERGVGYTLASGTSSCAAAAVARKLGFCGDEVVVKMPGGRLNVRFEGDASVTLSGPVTKVCTGSIFPEALSVDIPEPESVGGF